MDYKDIDAACNDFKLEQSAPMTDPTYPTYPTESILTETIITPDPCLAAQTYTVDGNETDDGAISLGAKVAIPSRIVFGLIVLLVFFSLRYIRRWIERASRSRRVTPRCGAWQTLSWRRDGAA